MTALLVVLLCAAFIGIDLLVREFGKRMEAAQARREREAALKTAVRLDFAAEAKSLKRVEVPNARARILAVDDEAVVLDSFRKILVLAGFSVDTVETGPEALKLVREHPYDFVFTDLKMPDMSGVEVVKAVKHLRPDVDVAVITGFGTIETAVETMQYGAVDYVQKPFTEDELLAFANRIQLRREARLEAQRRPTVRVVPAALAETVAAREYCVPGGAFVSPGHAWAQIEPDGAVCIGIDDFARKALRGIERVDLPQDGSRVERGQLLFVVRRGAELARFLAPVSGQVARVNAAVARDPGLMTSSPYERGWVCMIRPSRLAEELSGLRIGRPVVSWYQEEVARFRKESAGSGGDLRWTDLEAHYLGPGTVPVERQTEMANAG